MLGIRRTNPLLFVARDLKAKLMLERARRDEERKPKAEIKTEFGAEIPEQPYVSDEELAMRLGLVESESISVEKAKAQKEQLRKLMFEQRAKYQSTRQAFLEWQAGQREKGSAVRLYRQGLKAEGTKQLYAQTAGARLLSVAYYSELGDNSNNDVNSLVRERMLARRDVSKVSKGGLISLVRKR